jgi:hypothetical protein
VYVWDTSDWHQQAVMEGHQRPVTAVAFSPGSEVLASGSTDGTTILWDPVGGTAQVTAPGKCLGFARDGLRLAFHHGLRLGVWDVATGQACRRFHYGRAGNRMLWHSNIDIEGLDFGWGGRLLALCGNDGVRFWDVAAGDEVGFLPIGRHETALFVGDGTRLFTFGRTGLRCWPVAPARGAPAATLRVGPPERFNVPANQDFLRAARDRDGRLVALTDQRKRDVLLVDVARASTTAVSPGLGPAFDLDLSPDGRWPDGRWRSARTAAGSSVAP